jgi:hypothetical protein
VVRDRAGSIGRAEDEEEPGGKGHEDLVGLVDGDATGTAGGTCRAVDGDGGEVAKEEFLGRAGGGQDLDSLGVEAVADFLE